MVAVVNTLAVSTVHVAAQRVGTSWPWYIIRGAGFTAAGLLVLLMLSGIGQFTGIIYRWVEPIKMWAIHKAMAIALLVAIVVHVGFLLIDKFVPFSLVQVLVPFTSHYNNGTSIYGLAFGSLAVAFGILAAYLVMIVIASSLGWIDTKTKRWRVLHYLNYAIVLLVFLHALYVGSDLRYGMFRELWVLLGMVVLVAIVARIWRAGVIRRSK